LSVTIALYRINSVIRMANGDHEYHRHQIFNTPVMPLRNEALSSCRLLALHVRVLLSHKEKQYIRLTVYAPLTFGEILYVYTVDGGNKIAEYLHTRSVYLLFQITESFHKHILSVLFILTYILCKCNVYIHINSQNVFMDIYCISI